MTDQVLAETNIPNQNTNVTTSSDNTSEKLVPQAEVEKIVKGRMQDAYRKGRDEALAELQRTAPTANATMQQSSSPAVGMGGMSQLSPEEIRKLIAEEAPRVLQQQVQNANAYRVAQEFTQKMMSGKDKYSDFEDVVTPLNLASIPHIVHLANATDNAADVMYELGKNPHKIAILTQLANTHPHLAQLEMQKLSNSIKENEAAAKQKTANEPLGQVKSSVTGTDNGALSVRDLKRQDWLRA